MNAIVRVKNVSKFYRVGESNAQYETLRDVLARGLRSPFGRSAAREKTNGSSPETFWALQDVTFDVSPGEVLGIVGRNGAGKSTLLKVLSRITVPTKGRVELYGRVSSLL